jgi:hypothetical protein
MPTGGKHEYGDRWGDILRLRRELAERRKKPKHHRKHGWLRRKWEKLMNPEPPEKY